MLVRVVRGALQWWRLREMGGSQGQRCRFKPFLGVFFLWLMNVEGKKERGTQRQRLGSNRSDTKFDAGCSKSNSHTKRINQEF